MTMLEIYGMFCRNSGLLDIADETLGKEIEMGDLADT